MSTVTNPKLARPRLGRGLASLVSMSDLPIEMETPPAALAQPNRANQPPASSDPGSPVQDPQHTGQNEQVLSLAPDLILPNPHQPRKTFNESSIAELAASMKSSGLIQPIIVRPSNGQYELVAGQRRLLAAKAAGLSAIPAIVRQVDRISQAQMALIENIHREDLNPIERAQAYRAIVQEVGLTQAQLAERLGEDRSAIANYLRLLELPQKVQTMVRDGRLSLGHAKVIAGVPDILRQEKLADTAVSQELSVRSLERLVQEGGSPAIAKEKAAPSPHIKDLERSISRQLGMKVSVRASPRKGRGKLTIQYATLDQFDQLMGRLGIKLDD
jgi:ParB family chromosome partitioning protein